jgi:hypothetical protein
MLGGREPPVIASLKVGQERVTSAAGVVPGSIRELPAGTVTEAPKASEPV